MCVHVISHSGINTVIGPAQLFQCSGTPATYTLSIPVASVQSLPTWPLAQRAGSALELCIPGLRPWLVTESAAKQMLQLLTPARNGFQVRTTVSCEHWAPRELCLISPTCLAYFPLHTQFLNSLRHFPCKTFKLFTFTSIFSFISAWGKSNLRYRVWLNKGKT